LGWEDANPPALGNEGNTPLQQHKKPISETNQKVNVDEGPNNPGGKSGKAHESQVSDRIGSADDYDAALHLS
jgi:hypothetical protein